jgi:hypothetical protein
MPESPARRSLMDRWDDYQVTKTQAFGLAAACVAATLILGFSAGGWVTGGTARETVSEAATNARQKLATAVCVDEFMQAAGAASRLEKIEQAMWHERDELVSAGGWATMPDRKEPNSVLASLCASELAERAQADAKKVSASATQ